MCLKEKRKNEHKGENDKWLSQFLPTQSITAKDGAVVRIYPNFVYLNAKTSKILQFK